MKISVIIPTRDRPELLRSALASVAEQTRVELLKEVIVSENGESHGSQDACAEFPTLPIRYIRQCPTLPPGEHFVKLAGEASAEWCAMLGDDDIWSRYHLQEAERCLARTPDAVAFIGGCVCVENESRRVTHGFGSTLYSFTHPNEPGDLSPQVLDVSDIFAEIILKTIFNFWGVVGKSRAMKEAMTAFVAVDSFDCDRLFWWRLGSRGSLVTSPEITLFYRRHSGGTCGKMTKDEEASARGSELVTETIISEAKVLGLGTETLRDRYCALSERDRLRHASEYLPGAVRAIEKHLDLKLIDHKALSIAAHRQGMRKVFQQFIPPLAWTAAARLMRTIRHAMN